LITELHGRHEFGAVLLYFEFPQLKIVQDIIKPEDVYEDPSIDGGGIEEYPHVTLLYGLHDGVSTEQIKEVIDNINFGACKINNPSLFENEDTDVLKYDVSGQGLYEANNELRKLPYTSDFPEYHPHLTIAYLKPKTGKRYTIALQGQSFTIPPKYAVYSKTDGSKEKLEINTKI